MLEYNSQRDNFNFAGKFSGFKQCFSTCAWMLISHYSDRADGNNDDQLAWYVDQVETEVGKKGIAETLIQKFKWITGNTSYWGIIQQKTIESVLHAHGVQGECIFRIDNGTWEEISKILKTGPVILCTNKLPGLPGGHIILIVDETENGWIVYDPFGNANLKYIDKNGEGVLYEKEWLKSFTENINKNKKLMYLFWKMP